MPLMWLDDGEISPGMNIGFLDDALKTTGVRGLVDGMVPHGKTND